MTSIFNAIRNVTSRDARQARWLRKRFGLTGDRTFAPALEQAPEACSDFDGLQVRGMEVRTVEVDPAVFGLSAKRERDVHLGFRDEITERDLELALSRLG